MSQLPHGPYEAGATVRVLHTTAIGTTAVTPMVIECCVPLEDGVHWRIECRDGTAHHDVVVDSHGLASDGTVHPRGSDLDSVRSNVIHAALNLASVEWNNGRTSADASMHLDLAQDLFDDALAEYVARVNKERVGVMPHD